MILKDSPLLRDLDRALAVAGVIFSIILIIYLGREIGRVIYLLTGVLALISCLLWLAMRKSHTLDFHLSESRNQTLLWAICFFGLYTLSVLSVYLRPALYERPLLYFILTALMVGVIACEILTSGKQHAGLILIQILLLGVSLAWSQLLIFPSLVGVDPWYHYNFTSQILDGSYVPDSGSYSKLPMFHLMVAITSLLTTLPYKLATMVSVSLGQILCNGVFIYLIADRLFKNHRIGLLAALMVVIANHCISMSYWSIPNSFAAVFIPITLYILLFKAKHNSHDLLYTVLGIVMMGTIILTHTVVAMCMAILLFVVWGALSFFRIYSTKSATAVLLLIPLSFTITMYAWWTYASGSIRQLGDLIKWGFDIDIFSSTPKEFQSYAAMIPLNEQLFNNLGMFLFFTLSFIGIFYMVSRKGNGLTFAMAGVGLTPLAIGFFSLISGHSVIEHRWWYFAQIFLSIPLAVGLYSLATWKSRKTISVVVILFLLVVPLSFLTIMSPPANVDNHIFSPNSSMTYAFTDSEMKSISTMFDIRTNVIKADEYCAGSQKFVYPDVEPFCNEICTHEVDKLQGNTILIRKNILGVPFKVFSSIYQLDYNLISAIDNAQFSRIYDSGSVYGYE